ncbi:MAG: hypothetical protein K2F63_02690, partial [Muribaculaceae bacterium]|nr:hypothetical protein [Muribaculaceae bacterium]
MPHIKDVLSSEVHWQIAGWNVRDQANARVRQIMGEDAVIFAPVYVTHGGYYWSAPDLRGWRMLSDADVATNTSVHRHLDALRRKAIERFPAQESRIEQLFTVPNDDFIFFRTTDNVTEIRLTGWGFSNFKRAIGGQPIRDTEDCKLREITVSFIIDGIRQPDREFELRRPTGWVAMRTDADGIYSFGKQTPGTTIAVRDVSTGIERQVTVDTETGHVDIDVTEYLHLRINARHDGVAINGEHVIFHYGHRGGEAVLEQGVAEFRLPWMQGES